MPSPDAMFANSSSFSGRVHSDFFSNYHDPQKVVAPRAHKPPPAATPSSSSCRGAEQQCSTQHSSRLTASLQQPHELCSGQLELQRILLQGGNNPTVPELPSASIFGVSPPVRSGACGGAANPIAHDHSWTRSAYCASRTNLQALREIDSSGHPFLRSMDNSDLVLGSPVLGPMLPATLPASRPAGPAPMQQQQQEQLPFGGFTGFANFSFSAVPGPLPAAAGSQQPMGMGICRPQAPRPRPQAMDGVTMPDAPPATTCLAAAAAGGAGGSSAGGMGGMGGGPMMAAPVAAGGGFTPFSCSSRYFAVK